MVYSDSSLSLLSLYPVSNDKAFGMSDAGFDDEEGVDFAEFLSFAEFSLLVEDVVAMGFRFTKLANKDF